MLYWPDNSEYAIYNVGKCDCRSDKCNSVFWAIYRSNPKYDIDLISYADSSGGVNILGPKILGNSTGLSAFWVVTSILLGGGLFGFVGMVMGVPTFAVIYYIVDMILDNKLKKKKLPVRSESYDEWSYVDSSGEYIHSEEIKSKAEEK